MNCTFYIDSWYISVWIATDVYDDGILEDLTQCGASGDAIRCAYMITKEKKRNVGMTFSNPKREQSVVIIGLSDSMGEMINTIFHETFHLAVHIAKKRKLKLDGEDICYLVGKIGQMLFGKIVADE